MKNIYSSLVTKFISLNAILLIFCVQAIAQTPQYYVTPTGTGGNYFPFGSTTGAAGSKVQLLYRPSDFNSPPPIGFISKLYFMGYSSASSTARTIDIEVSMGNTSMTNVSTTWVTGLTLNGLITSYSFNMTPNVWCIQLPLTTPFYYDGVSNIIVDLSLAAGSGGTDYIMTVTPPTGGMVHRAYGVYGSGSATGTDGAGGAMYRMGFDLFAGFPCKDTPKTSIAGPKIVCPNKPFSLQPDSFYSNATYKWEYSKNGVNWSNFTGVPGLYADIKDSITDTKWYRLTITCDSNKNLTWTTPPHKIGIAPFYYCYCDNNVTKDAGADIGNVTIVNTRNDDSIYKKSKLVTGTGFPIYNNSKANRRYTGYHDSLAWPCLYRDTTYRFIVSQIHSGGTLEMGVVQLYIDYDRDGLYNPNTERVFVKAIDGNGVPPEAVIVAKSIPSNAEIGPTGMRVIISKDTVKGAPCDTISGGGEVEDYIVEICHRPCDGPVKTGIVSSTDTSMCPSYEYRLTDTTYEKERSAFTRAWQVSGDDISWFNIANSQNKDTLERIFTGQPLYYRLRTICIPTHDTSYSVATKINVKPGYKCYCYSKAVGGKNIDTSDIGGVTIAGYSSNAGGPHLMNQNAVRPRTDYTDITPVEIFTDSVYKFTVYHTMPVIEHGDSKVTIFMDFNNNNQYEIPDERIYTGYTTIGNHTLIDNVIVPMTAITDVPTGMRVILNNDVGPNIPSDEACGPYTSGETEDYLLVFRKKWGAGIDGIHKLSGFNVHPNPTSGKFYIQFSTQANINEVKVRVTNVTGQVIEEQLYGHNGGVFYKELDMTGKASGVYFVELQADGQKLMRKLVVQ